jgi:hypothetical protein
MTTLAYTGLFPFFTTKLFWIRANRVLAWSLLASPALQWMLGTGFGTGLAVDLAILFGHGALSFSLFGKPETKARVFSASMHLFGLRLTALSARNAFLLTGYRIGAGMLAIVLLFTPIPMLWLPLLYPLLRLPVSVCQHIARAVAYALRRWGMRDNAEGAAALIVVVYIVVSIFSLGR